MLYFMIYLHYLLLGVLLCHLVGHQLHESIQTQPARVVLVHLTVASSALSSVYQGIMAWAFEYHCYSPLTPFSWSLLFWVRSPKPSLQPSNLWSQSHPGLLCQTGCNEKIYDVTIPRHIVRSPESLLDVRLLLLSEIKFGRHSFSLCTSRHVWKQFNHDGWRYMEGELT